MTVLPVAPVPEGVPPVSAALEAWLEGLKDANPVLVALARALAASIDGKSMVAASDATELRRVIGVLEAAQARAGARNPAQRPLSALEELRRARAEANRERGGA